MRWIVAFSLMLVGCASSIGGHRRPELPRDVRGAPPPSMAGRVTLLLFWTSWSRPSRSALQALDGLERKFRPRLVTIAVAEDGPTTEAQVTTAAAELGLSMPVVIDADSSIAARLGTRSAIPSFVLFDRTGRVLRVIEGFLPGDDAPLEREVRRALEAP